MANLNHNFKIKNRFTFKTSLYRITSHGYKRFHNYVENSLRFHNGLK